jgi:hypothetical protein
MAIDVMGTEAGIGLAMPLIELGMVEPHTPEQRRMGGLRMERIVVIDSPSGTRV